MKHLRIAVLSAMSSIALFACGTENVAEVRPEENTALVPAEEVANEPFGEAAQGLTNYSAYLGITGIGKYKLEQPSGKCAQLDGNRLIASPCSGDSRQVFSVLKHTAGDYTLCSQDPQLIVDTLKINFVVSNYFLEGPCIELNSSGLRYANRNVIAARTAQQGKDFTSVKGSFIYTGENFIKWKDNKRALTTFADNKIELADFVAGDPRQAWIPKYVGP